MKRLTDDARTKLRSSEPHQAATVNGSPTRARPDEALIRNSPEPTPGGRGSTPPSARSCRRGDVQSAIGLLFNAPRRPSAWWQRPNPGRSDRRTSKSPRSSSGSPTRSPRPGLWNRSPTGRKQSIAAKAGADQTGPRGHNTVGHRCAREAEAAAKPMPEPTE